MQMHAVYVETITVCWVDGLLSWLISCKAPPHPHLTAPHTPFAFCSNYAFTTNFSPFLELLSSFIFP